MVYEPSNMFDYRQWLIKKNSFTSKSICGKINERSHCLKCKWLGKKPMTSMYICSLLILLYFCVTHKIPIVVMCEK